MGNGLLRSFLSTILGFFRPFFGLRNSLFHLFDRAPPLRYLPINAPGGIFHCGFFPLLNARISSISMHLSLLPMQKFIGLGDV